MMEQFRQLKKMNKLFSTAGFELHMSFGFRITDLHIFAE